MSWLEGRRLLTLLLIGTVAWSLATVAWGDGVLHTGGLSAAGEIARSFFQADLSSGVLRAAGRAAWQTVAYAVAGMTIALLIGLPLGAIASGTLQAPGPARRIVVPAVRFLLAFFRSIHELVWALLFVAATGLSPMAAVLAIGISYGGILGRIYADLLKDGAPEPTLRALRSAGASEGRVFWYGRLPMALPDMVSYTFYRFECALRSAAIMSFVGLGGLGRNIQLALDDLAYERMWTFVFTLALLIIIADVWSSLVRRRIVA